MDIQQQQTLLSEIGGEPLDGSRFEFETPAFEDDDEFTNPVEEQEDEQ
jgi:hypothetical protein